jgi:hypothetical protein
VTGPLDFQPDEQDRAPRSAPPPVPPPRRHDAGSRRSTYTWVIGVAALVLVAVLVVTTLTSGTGRGARGVRTGDIIPPFAVPLALSNLDGDANLARRAGEGQAGDRPACSVRGPRILNGCALAEHGPFVLAFFATRGRECIAQLDTIERVRARVPGVGFAAVAIRGDRDALRALVRAHRWSFPVGYDHDGALANAYHVQVCPQLTFARRGGRVAATTFGTLRAADLLARVRRLEGVAG